MNASEQALSVYDSAQQRFAARQETLQDEVVMALWAEVTELSRTVRAQALRLSFLETRTAQDDAETECTALLARLGKL